MRLSTSKRNADATTVKDAEPLAAHAAIRRREFVRYLREGPVPRLRVMAGRAGDGDPEVTVIIPTVDGARGGNLSHLLSQLHQQTFQRFEVIIVEGDRRQGRAINIAAAIAQGRILVTMDDDTRLGPNDVLEKIARVFAADRTIGIAGVSNLVPADAPWVVRQAMEQLPRRSSPIVDEVTVSDMAEHPCLAIRKELFYQVGGEHELIPRGLDPYLRREVRRLGYQVVVIPNTWIHHLLPGTLSGILRQYFRNGMGAAYVKKIHPAFVIDQALEHFQEVPITTLRTRMFRYLRQLLGALLTRKWIYAGTLLSYALGYTWGLIRLEEHSL